MCNKSPQTASVIKKQKRHATTDYHSPPLPFPKRTMNDIDDHLAWLRYERGKAAQTLSTYRRLLYQFAEAHRERDLHSLEQHDLQHYLLKTLGGGGVGRQAMQAV